MKSFSRLRDCGCFLLIFLLTISASAANWSGPAADLAKAIAAASGPGTITFSVVNSSSIPKDQATEIQRDLEAQLRTSGVRIGAAANANSDVHITLSENLQGYVWVAEIKQGNDTHVEMVTVPRAQSAIIANNAPSVTIRKVLMWSQPTQMIDMMLLDASTSNPKMVVLDAEAISIYSLHDGKWQRDQNWAITHTRPFPRDLRGLLVAGKDHAMDAYLPGTVCNVTSNALICRESDDAWRIGPRAAFYNSARNYFNGALVPASDKPLGPFYSMAWIEKPSHSLILSTGVDGRVRMIDGVNDRTLSSAATSDWGSDIAGLKSNCGAGAQVLVTSNGDDNAADSIRAYEIPDRDPVLASAAIDLPGPITALWSHDASSATAIAHNLQTGQYEAYSLSITCNQ